MKVWKLTAPQKLRHETKGELTITDTQAKIKITKALVSEADAAVYEGTHKVKYPVVLGHFAVGQVTETGENAFMQKGDRVYLPPVREDELAPTGISIAGEHFNGYFQDFVVANADEAFVLPPSVTDDSAFLIDAVALAEHIVDEMQITTGQHILVVGGGLYGNVLCQILIYHRAVPVLIDNNKDRLALAKKCGIYYTFPNDDTLAKSVTGVTGGKLADGAVYLAFSNKSELSSLFPLVKHGGKTAVCALHEKPLTINFENALKHCISVLCITESREFVSTAINVLANKAISFANFPITHFPESQLPDLLKEASQKLTSGVSPSDTIQVVDFVF